MLKEGTKYRVAKGPIHSNFGKVFETGDRGTLRRDDDDHWSLIRRKPGPCGGRGVCNDIKVWESMIAMGTLVEIEAPKLYDVAIEERCTRTAIVRVRAASPKAAARRAQKIVGSYDVPKRLGEDHDFEWFSDAIGKGRTRRIDPVSDGQ